MSSYDSEQLTQVNDDIVREIFPNKHFRTYHLRTIIMTKEQISDIINIDGVTQDKHLELPKFIPHKYTLDIGKGKAFSWEEIEPKIVEIICK